jgi:protein-S-isoprenylcysteine O-methyltransferase Ste14
MSQRADTPAKPNSGVRIFPPGVYAIGLVVGYALQWLWPLPIVPTSGLLAVQIAGAVIVIAGVALIVSATMLFRRLGTSPNPTLATTALAVHGPYRFTRNPMYLGLAFLQAGLSLAGNALWPLIALVPVVWIIQTRVIAREESYLKATFGTEYLPYYARVRRWI